MPLHDLWAVDLPHTRSYITLDEFPRASNPHECKLSPGARALVGIRLFASRLLGWERTDPAMELEAFGARLTADDRAKSLVPAGRPEGLFRIVYRFKNEQLVELINRTAHAAVLTALVETSTAYRFYFGIYVRSVSRFTPVHMAMIDPFRERIVYPSRLRTVRVTWDRTLGTVCRAGLGRNIIGR